MNYRPFIIVALVGCLTGCDSTRDFLKEGSAPGAATTSTQTRGAAPTTYNGAMRNPSPDRTAASPSAQSRKDDSISETNRFSASGSAADTSHAADSSFKASSDSTSVDRPVKLGTLDRTFVEKAASGGLFEIRSSQRALTQDLSPTNKEMAEMLITDHTMANEELRRIALSKGMLLSDDLLPAQSDMLKQLSETTGALVNEKFVALQIQAHQDAIALFEDYAHNGSDVELMNFADDTLPTLKKHLEHLQTLSTP